MVTGDVRPIVSKIWCERSPVRFRSDSFVDRVFRVFRGPALNAKVFTFAECLIRLYANTGFHRFWGCFMHFDIISSSPHVSDTKLHMIHGLPLLSSAWEHWTCKAGFTRSYITYALYPEKQRQMKWKDEKSKRSKMSMLPCKQVLGISMFLVCMRSTQEEG
eukprot:jgi/Mesvir1/20683/Mv25512-RA.1